eukprot:3876633-Amphidinium_carterae.1
MRPIVSLSLALGSCCGCWEGEQTYVMSWLWLQNLASISGDGATTDSKVQRQHCAHEHIAYQQQPLRVCKTTRKVVHNAFGT